MAGPWLPAISRFHMHVPSSRSRRPGQRPIPMGIRVRRHCWRSRASGVQTPMPGADYYRFQQSLPLPLLLPSSCLNPPLDIRVCQPPPVSESEDSWLRLRPYTVAHQTCAGPPSEVKWRQRKTKSWSLPRWVSGRRCTCPQWQVQITNGTASTPDAGQLKVWQPAVTCCGMHLPLMSHLGDGRGWQARAGHHRTVGTSTHPTFRLAVRKQSWPPSHNEFNRGRPPLTATPNRLQPPRGAWPGDMVTRHMSVGFRWCTRRCRRASPPRPQPHASTAAHDGNNRTPKFHPGLLSQLAC
jgi:hypothetical protein